MDNLYWIQTYAYEKMLNHFEMSPEKNKQSYTIVMAIEKGVINAPLSIAFTFFHI